MGGCIILLVLFFLLPGTLASDWDDFTDNLATDLAPLISLFGERLTTQFLSESTSVLDNFTFAVAPLGILTAVVSAIRVCGNSSLRAFVGRAQEGPGDAENELLSCVSESTSELFNDGGISRVFGKPKILEVVAWEDDIFKTPGSDSLTLGTLRDAIRKGAWGPDDIIHESKYVPELEIPNLSLNKGIKRRSPIWFYCAAVLGFVLQVAITVYIYPDDFQKDGNAVPSYAFPLFFLGTIFLGVGMFLCAFILERSSKEYYFEPKKPSKIYWLQPGGQNVGDQVFGAFLGVTEGYDSKTSKDLLYIKSMRDQKRHVKDYQLLSIVTVTMVGFILQFVGLRGLHASVILAQMGCTLLMAIVRTSLRTKRVDKDENKFSASERRLTSHYKQELDCFAFHLEGVESFHLLSNPADESTQAPSSPSSGTTSLTQSVEHEKLGTRAVQTRARLAKLTSGNDQGRSIGWEDLPIRKVAQNLAQTIEMTMDTLSNWKHMPPGSGDFQIFLKCKSSAQNSVDPITEAYLIKLERSEDTLRWRIDETELEAVLGLWTWSLLKSNPEDWLQKGLGRLVGLNEAEARTEETDLYFHKWIFRQTEARMVSSKIVSSDRLFGFYSDDFLYDKEVLVAKTQNTLETMAAQDIYMHFLKNVLGTLDKLGGDVGVLPGSQDGFFAYSNRLEDLVGCFESGDLGSREDALLCIVPPLRYQGLLPELAADSSSVREQVEDLITSDKWSDAFSIVRWLCERCEAAEFENSIYELGLLCQKAMLHDNPKVQKEGFDEVCTLLQSDVRVKLFQNLLNPRRSGWVNSQENIEWWDSFTKQLGWVAWHLCDTRPGTQPMKPILESLGAGEDLTSVTNENRAKEALLQWLTHGNDDLGAFEGVSSDEDLFCILQWVTQNAHSALQHWILVKWADIGKQFPWIILKAFVFAAKTWSDPAIRTLRRHDADIDIQAAGGYTALMELIDFGDLEAVKKLIAHGADVNACGAMSHFSPLSIAASQGNEEMTALLLDHGANLEIQDKAGQTALSMASRNDQLSTTHLLLKRGADIETVGRDSMTPLITASSNAHQRQMIELLLDNGANINAQDNDGHTPLMMAVRTAPIDTVRLLLDRKANIKIQDENGLTALDWAQSVDRADACGHLVEAVSQG
ncbi:hypothetical protein MW887_002588 [Aspergillus wentii]|nr:hypothetical protein MW887_002588 [Aspergillus wentii]